MQCITLGRNRIHCFMGVGTVDPAGTKQQNVGDQLARVGNPVIGNRFNTTYRDLVTPKGGGGRADHQEQDQHRPLPVKTGLGQFGQLLFQVPVGAHRRGDSVLGLLIRLALRFAGLAGRNN